MLGSLIVKSRKLEPRPSSLATVNTASPRKSDFEMEGSNYKYCSIEASPTVT
jgi:hypothetical protein